MYTSNFHSKLEFPPQETWRARVSINGVVVDEPSFSLHGSEMTAVSVPHDVELSSPDGYLSMEVSALEERVKKSRSFLLCAMEVEIQNA